MQNPVGYVPNSIMLRTLYCATRSRPEQQQHSLSLSFTRSISKSKSQNTKLNSIYSIDFHFNLFDFAAFCFFFRHEKERERERGRLCLTIKPLNTYFRLLFLARLIQSSNPFTFTLQLVLRISPTFCTKCPGTCASVANDPCLQKTLSF
jgi:hypothetical protein